MDVRKSATDRRGLVRFAWLVALCACLVTNALSAPVDDFTVSEWKVPDGGKVEDKGNSGGGDAKANLSQSGDHKIVTLTALADARQQAGADSEAKGRIFVAATLTVGPKDITLTMVGKANGKLDVTSDDGGARASGGMEVKVDGVDDDKRKKEFEKERNGAGVTSVPFDAKVTPCLRANQSYQLYVWLYTSASVIHNNPPAGGAKADVWSPPYELRVELTAKPRDRAPSQSGPAGHSAESTIWVTQVVDQIDTGWVIQSPTGSTDWFSVGNGVQCHGDYEQLSDGLPLAGIAVSVTDFGSGRTYPRAGVYQPNVTLDPSGITPNLAAPIIEVTSPALSPPPLFHYATFDTSESYISEGSTKVVSAVQLPAGDSGLLGIGADSTTGHPGAGTSGFSTDGYATPSIVGTFLDFGLNPGQDNSSTASCVPADRKPHGRLRASRLLQGIGAGDHLTTDIEAGDTLNLAFFGSRSGDRLRLYFSVTPCTPAVAIGPVLPTIPDADGDGSYIRLNATWPPGYGGQTFRFSAVWGNPACATPGVGFTNCVTVITLPDPVFGVCDDGTIESGWVVQIPSASSDYFNNNLGNGVGQNGVVGLTIAVLDFGTATPAFTSTGVSNANTSVDPTGNTPDIGSPLASVSPFTFPSLTFATTSGQYISHAVSITGGSLGTDVHGWLQFPPGDSGLLGCGADSTANNGCSFFTLDGYNSPAVSFTVNWGIRIATN